MVLSQQERKKEKENVQAEIGKQIIDQRRNPAKGDQWISTHQNNNTNDRIPIGKVPRYGIFLWSVEESEGECA